MALGPAPSQSLCLFAHISLTDVNDGGGGGRGLWRRVSARLPPVSPAQGSCGGRRVAYHHWCECGVDG